MIEIIKSKDNAHIKLFMALNTQKKQRTANGLFTIEGVRLCNDAALSGVKIQTLLLTERAAERYKDTETLKNKAEQTVWICDDLADKISDTKSPQGVFAVCEMLDIGKSTVTINNSGHYILLHNIQDPGNLGAILRTADAMGVDGVFLGEDCADIYNPKVIRGSMGGMFRLNISSSASCQSDIESLKSAGIDCYAAALTDDAKTAGTVDFSSGAAVLIGNEGAGLPYELVEQCSASIIIPMAQGANSLNAAVAAGMLMWEMRRWRI